ncbi:hypothetical protein ABPG75_002741 [Micractinium tetrahymenae]
MPAAAEVQNTRGRLPLHVACECGHKEVVGPLLAAAPHAASVHDSIQWLPIHCAANRGDEGIVQQLLAATPHTASAAQDFGSTPLSWLLTAKTSTPPAACWLQCPQQLR